MKSMTGFGRCKMTDEKHYVDFTVEISSLNKKNLDVKLNIPSELNAYETIIRKIISEKLSRGLVTVKITMNTADNALFANTIKINKHVIQLIMREVKRIKKAFSIKGELMIGDIINIPGVIEVASPDYSVPDIAKTLTRCVKKALSELIDMQKREGKNLKKDISGKIGNISEIVKRIKPVAKKIPDIKRDMLIKRLENAGLPVDTTDEHILKEIVIFTDKSDISEEITRIESHIMQLKKFLRTTNEPVGRNIDFLIQEMLREITTIGNKAVHKDISPLVVEFKNELEQIREQSRNIE